MLVLPPLYTKLVLYTEYCKWHLKGAPLYVSDGALGTLLIKTFRGCVFLNERVGFSAHFFAYLDSVCTIRDLNLDARARQCKVHLLSAEESRRFIGTASSVHYRHMTSSSKVQAVFFLGTEWCYLTLQHNSTFLW